MQTDVWFKPMSNSGPGPSGRPNRQDSLSASAWLSLQNPTGGAASTAETHPLQMLEAGHLRPEG